LYSPILGCLSTVIFGKAIQRAEKKLNVDDTIVRSIQALPAHGKIFERVSFLDFFSTPCYVGVSMQMVSTS
jgi:hypothetical protein